ncbi:hypothetical protein ASE38_01680 [Cellulomonas sp. Root930]|nr:hypothetical protein ASE38_01680 [Cellulomonas sp. Root930]
MSSKIEDRILGSSGRLWTPADLSGAPSTKSHLLSCLTARGELQRIRKGLYWRGRMTPLGMAPPPPELITRALLPKVKGIGPAGLSAANRLRLSTQVPRRAHIAVPHRAPTSTQAVRYLSRAARHERGRQALSETEVALLEVLEAWNDVIEVSEAQAWALLGQLVRSSSVRPDRLAAAAKTEPAAVRSRLARLLRETDQQAAAAKIPAVDRRVSV